MEKKTKVTIIIWLIIFSLFNAFCALTAKGQSYTPYLTVSGSADTLFEEQWAADTSHRWSGEYMAFNRAVWKLCKAVNLNRDTSIIYDNVEYPMIIIIRDTLRRGWRVYSWMNEESTDNPYHDIRQGIYVKKRTKYQLRRYIFYAIVWQRSTGCFWDY